MTNSNYRDACNKVPSSGKFLPSNKFASSSTFSTSSSPTSNSSLSSSGRTMTPYERHKGHRPNIKHIRVFGCPVLYRIHKTAKWEQQGRRGVHIGPARDSAGYKIYNPMYRVTAISNDVIFDENFVSATSRTLPVRNRDGELLRTFPLYTSPLTRQNQMDWTGTLSNIFGSSAQQTFSDDPSEDEQNYSSENESQTGSVNPSTVSNDSPQSNFEPSQESPPQLTEESALLSILFEGGTESISKMPSKDNKQKLMIYKSETNAEENLLKTQGVPLTMEMMEQENQKDNCNYCKQKHTKHLSQESLDEEQQAFHTVETIHEEDAYALLELNPESRIKTEECLIRELDKPFFTAEDFIPEPSNEYALIKMPEGKIKHEWIQKTILEVRGLIKENTFSLDHLPEENERVTPTKVTYKAKINSDGSLNKCKARLVVRGDLQAEIPGDQWSPTASFRLLRRFIAEAARTGKSIKQLDFISAFVQAVVKERIFVKFPGCLKKYFPEELEKYFDRPLKLNKGLYGTTHSAKWWWEELHEWLESQGYECAQSERCLYVKRWPNNRWIKIINYIDDMLYIGDSEETEKDFEKAIGTRFRVEFKGAAHWYLAARITRDKLDLIMDQSRYVKNIIKRYDNGKIVVRNTPVNPDTIFTKKDCPKDDEAKALVQKEYGDIDYRSAVGSLIYLMTGTRYDICFATTKLAKFCNEPGKVHYQALIWLLGYLKQTGNLGIRYYHNEKNSPLGEMLARNNIQAEGEEITFSDSSWQDCKDTARSTGSFATTFQGGLIDYASFVPDPIAASSGEAEYNTSSVACMSVLHNRYVDQEMKNLGLEIMKNHEYTTPGGKDWKPSLILLDSTAAISMAETARCTSRTRHIDRRFHYVRQGQAAGRHKLSWISNTDQIADIGTKAVTLAALEPIMKLIYVEVSE